jgi:hypothetical protein
MAANAATAGELERAEEISEGSPIRTLESALRRALSTSSRADHKGGWPGIGQLINPSKNFLKICNVYKTMTASFKKKFLPQ